MKERKNASFLKRVLVNCVSQAKEYGNCIAQKVPEIEHDMCLKEFLALKSCMQNTKQGVRFANDWQIVLSSIIKLGDLESASVFSLKLVTEDVHSRQQSCITEAIQQVKEDMLGKISSDQPRAGLSGSGALSHVYIQHPPLRCSIPETQGLYYDDGNKLILAPTSDQVLSWNIGPSTQLDPPNSDSISEGPVLSIRYSLDKKVIGIQRSNYEIQFKNRETGETFSRRCRQDSESILGFFWTDCPSCDIIFIKTSGIDLLSYEPELNTLRLVEAKRFNVSWYAYTHESRLVLLASGMQCNIFSGYQVDSTSHVIWKTEIPLSLKYLAVFLLFLGPLKFSSGGVIRLPKFEMTMAKAEANRKPVLAADDIHIVTIYGRIYCLQLDRAGMLLNLYRFYRDAVVQQGTLPIYSSRIAVSVVDNVLLVHQVDAKVVILYDIFLDSLAPISAPLPLLLRATSSSSRQTVQVEDNLTASYGGTIYGESWTFLVPDLICDVDNGLLWKICLDLEAIAASSSDIPSVLDFLQRRRSQPGMIRKLCLAILRTIILERRPISMIARAIDVIVTSYSHLVKMGSALWGGESVSAVKTEHSFGQHGVNSVAASEEPTTRIANRGKSIREESLSGAENEQQQSTAQSKPKQTSFYSVSDSEGDANLEAAGTSLGDLSLAKSSSGDLHASVARDEMRKSTGERNSHADFEQSPLQSERLEESSSLSDPYVSNQQGFQLTSGAISPDEMCNFVFAVVEDEMGGDPGYLVAAVVEFLKSISKERLKVHPNLYVMMIQLLARTNRYAELALFIRNKILEPSKDVAFQLLELGRENIPIRKLGLDMLRQLSLHHDYVTELLQDGYYLEALRYARKFKVVTVRPSLFLEAAIANNNPLHLAAVLRFFSDFTPSFQSTSDFNRYHQILIEMS